MTQQSFCIELAVANPLIKGLDPKEARWSPASAGARGSDHVQGGYGEDRGPRTQGIDHCGLIED